MGGQPILGILRARFKIYTRYPGWMIMNIIVPIVITMMPVFLAFSVAGSMTNAGNIFYKYTGTRDMVFYIIVGATVWSLSNGILWDFGMWLYEEMEAGTLEQVLLTPVSVFELLLGSVLYTLLISFINSMLGLVITGALFGYLNLIFSIEFVMALGIILLGFIPLFGMSIFFGAIVLKIKEPWSFINVLTAFLVFISGVFYPITILPPLARFIALLFPTTLQIADARAIMLHIEYVFSPTVDILILLSYALIWPIIGAMMFSRAKKELKEKGSIGAP
ncbi:MAG: ABC transporter permease [Candidatus Njordarchaeota archaeon]